MRGVIRWLVLALTLSQGISVAMERRSRRSLEDMARMVRATTGRSAMDFNDYGNFCGLGGEGHPVDGIDRCCAIHDRCYSILIKARCFPYLVPYRYFINDRHIYCNGNENWCQETTCNCDRQLAQCIALYPYHSSYKHYPGLGPQLTHQIKNIMKLMML